MLDEGHREHKRRVGHKPHGGNKIKILGRWFNVDNSGEEK